MDSTALYELAGPNTSPIRPNSIILHCGSQWLLEVQERSDSETVQDICSEQTDDALNL
jgi:hypothetical protein